MPPESRPGLQLLEAGKLMSRVEVNMTSGDGKSTVQHGRTDGRTYEELLTATNHVTGRIAHTRVQAIEGFASVGQVIEAGELWRTNQRHDRVRTGDRDEIPTYVRAAIWFRDGGRCSECHPEYPNPGPMHLDHIKPWSAGGSDTSDNLRLLCGPHNLERSNFIDSARPKRAVTWWCSNCYVLDEHVWQYHGAYVTCPTHGAPFIPEKSTCRVSRAFWKAHRDSESTPTWHQSQPLLESYDLIAYCAHCDAPGMTGVVL